MRSGESDFKMLLVSLRWKKDTFKTKIAFEHRWGSIVSGSWKVVGCFRLRSGHQLCPVTPELFLGKQVRASCMGSLPGFS